MRQGRAPEVENGDRLTSRNSCGWISRKFDTYTSIPLVRVSPARDDCGHPFPQGRRSDMTHRVDTLVNAVQPTPANAARDAIGAYAGQNQLPRRDHTVLASRNLSNDLLGGPFLSHTDIKEPATFVLPPIFLNRRYIRRPTT